MPNIAVVLRQEITRLARKELKTQGDALRKALSQQRATIATLRRRIEVLESQVRKAKPAAQTAAQTDEPRLRFRSSGFAMLRRKLELSAKDMGLLIGVSPLTIYKWEHGTSKPRAKQLSAIAAARSLGKRAAASRLENLQAKSAPKRRKSKH